jgi:hypothetical protein
VQQSAKLSRKGPRILVLRETHTPPDWATDFLTRAGGLNRFGEPNFRVIWGWNRLGWVGGRFTDHDGSGTVVREVLDVRLMPKYPCVNRWIVEQWLPPEKYGSPENWYRQTKEWGEEGNIPQLGPYPSRGDYELLCVLETPEQEFVQLTTSILDDVLVALRFAKARSYTESVIARKDAKAKQLRRDAKYAHAYLNEQTVPAFNEKMFVTVL